MITTPTVIPAGYHRLEAGTKLLNTDLCYKNRLGDGSNLETHWHETFYAGSTVEGDFATECVYIRKNVAVPPTPKKLPNYVEYKFETVAKADAVIAYLKAAGYGFHGGSSGASYCGSIYRYLQINTETKWCGGNDKPNHPSITFNEIFSLITIPEVTPFTPIKVKLNDTYTAEVQEDGSVKVGCQSFPYEKLVKLMTEAQKVVDKK